MTQIISALENEALPPHLIKNRRKYRYRGETCYKSTPNWTKINGNIPCPPGTICRPSTQNLRLGSSITGASSRCYPDSQIGKKGTNFQFTPSFHRKKSTSYTYRRKEIGGDWTYFAGFMQECYKSIPNYKARKCLPGLICSPLKHQIGLSGNTSFCQKQNTVKPAFLEEGEECSLNLGEKMCPPTTTCRYQVKESKFTHANITYYKTSDGHFCLAQSKKIKKPSYIPSNHRCSLKSNQKCSPGNVCRSFFMNKRNMGTFCLPRILKSFRANIRRRTITTRIRYINGVKVSEVTY